MLHVFHLLGNGAGPELQAVALAHQHHVVGRVDQAVQGAFREDGIGEEGVPVLRAAVGRDDAGGPSGALVDELIEVLSLSLGELLDSEVIQDQEIGLDVKAEPLLPGSVGPSSAQVAQEAVLPRKDC